MGRTLLVVVELVSASIWVGGLIAIGVVARVARLTLEPARRIDFFRLLGRHYLRVGGSSLLVALACGAGLLADGDWAGAKSVAAALGIALVLTTIAGVVQARSLTVLRRSALEDGAPTALLVRVDRKARSAALLRGAIGVLTLALLVVSAVLVD